MTDCEEAGLESADGAGVLEARVSTRSRLAGVVRGVAVFGKRFSNSRWWPLTAALVGAGPLIAFFGAGVYGHQIASAILLSILCLGFVVDDRWCQCLAAISLAFIAHSLLAIALARSAPERSSAVLPKAEAYWERQHSWITTGVNEEYEVSSWLPAHIQMFFGIAIFSFTSFGAVVFHDGFVQVDMMNYYNARLALESESQVRAIGFGWHLWSIMRGLGYLFVTYEMISLAHQFFAGQTNSTGARRRLRWALGIGCLTADCVIKYFAVEAVRLRLHENLT